MTPTSDYVLIASKIACLLLVVGGCASDAADSPEAAATVQRIATSPTHSCALREAGLYCWGSNFAGQLGRGDAEESETPVHASVAGTDIAEIAVATGRTCVRRSTGALACWGANERGQIGDGTRDGAMTATVASKIDDAAQFAIDEGSTCVVRAGDGSVACWGNSPASAPDEGSLRPAKIEGLAGIVEVRAGSLGTYCARDKSGDVLCWRFEEGAWTAPSEVSELAGARALAMTWFDEVCAISSTQEVVCHNLDSARTDVLPRSSDSSLITASGGIVACAMKATGKWRCWNVAPQTIDRSLAVKSAVPVVDLSVAGLSACALHEDQSVGCFDANQITEPPTDTLPAFIPVDGLPL